MAAFFIPQILNVSISHGNHEIISLSILNVLECAKIEVKYHSI